MSTPPAPPIPPAPQGLPSLGTPRRQWISSDPYMRVKFGNNFPPFTTAAKFSFEWWFNQFWRECPDQDRRAFYIEMLNPDGTPKKPSMSDVQKRDILGRMLRSGFTEFTGDYLENDDITLPGIRSGPNRVYVAFRGDFRTPNEVRVHEGTYAKASLPVLRNSMNMSQPWHPFSDPATRMKLYFRKWNADNCLFTVVSVAEDFATATKFPLMCDMENWQFGTAVVTARGYVAGEDVRNLAARFGSTVPAPARSGGSTQKILKASRNNVYVVKTGTAYNTRRMQDAGPAGSPFPERAVRGIPWSHHLARIRIDRIHYGKDSNEGHLIVVRGFDWLHDHVTLARTLGSSAAVGVLDGFLTDILQRGSLTGGQGGISFKTEASDPAIEIEKVISIDLQGAWI
jgi:hypothetical protein